MEFGDVVGQDHVLATLRGCLAEGRMPHAFLFSGSRGVGKTTTARILARTVNCEAEEKPCGSCLPCRTILDGSATDVIELDAASNNSVDDVRALREQACYAPIRLRKKVFILDEVHMFSRAAFNALLKILEEPPAHVMFILATTESHKVPETVRSRCQVLPFRRIQANDIQARLAGICQQEGVRAAPEVLEEIAVSSMGGMRDAETALERILPLAEELDIAEYRRLVGRLGVHRAAEVVAACLDGDLKAALGYATEACETGVDERECLGELLGILRQLLLLLVDGNETPLVEASGAWRETLQQLASQSGLECVDAMMQIVILARERIRQLDDRRALLELTLVRLARVQDLQSLGELGAAADRSERPADRLPANPGSKPAPATCAQEPEPSKAPDAWVRTVETVRAERETLGAILESAQPRWGGEGNACLFLSWGVLRDIEKRLLAAPATVDYLRRILRRQRGSPVEVRLELDSASHTEAQPPENETRGTVRASKEELPPLGKTAVDLFDVRHLEREDERS